MWRRYSGLITKSAVVLLDCSVCLSHLSRRAVRNVSPRHGPIDQGCTSPDWWLRRMVRTDRHGDSSDRQRAVTRLLWQTLISPLPRETVGFLGLKWRREREGIVQDATDVNKMLISDKNTRFNLQLILFERAANLISFLCTCSDQNNSGKRADIFKLILMSRIFSHCSWRVWFK